jgi:hypothetical protein
LGKELATTKVDDIVATSTGRGQTTQKILENYHFLHMQVTFVFARMVPIGPNLFHNNEISKVIP